jgi:hypothetical protein
MFQRWRVVIFSERGNCINRETQSIRYSHSSGVACVTEEAFNQVGCKAQLVEMYCHHRRCDALRKMNAKKPFDNAHKFHFAASS